MTSVDERIQKLEERLKQEKARKALIEARKRGAEQKRIKATTDKKKYLLGAFVLEQIEKGGIGFQFVSYESASFADWLTRDTDRALFGLPPSAKAEVKQTDQPVGFAENQT